MLSKNTYKSRLQVDFNFEFPNKITCFFLESKRVRQKYTDSKFNVPYGASVMESFDIYFKGQEFGGCLIKP